MLDWLKGVLRQMVAAMVPWMESHPPAGVNAHTADAEQQALGGGFLTFSRNAEITVVEGKDLEDSRIKFTPILLQPFEITEALCIAKVALKTVIKRAYANGGGQKISSPFLGGNIFAQRKSDGLVEFGMSGVQLHLVPFWSEKVADTNGSAIGTLVLRANNGAELALTAGCEGGIGIRHGNISIWVPTSRLEGDALQRARDAMRRLWHGAMDDQLWPVASDISGAGMPAIERSLLQFAGLTLPKNTVVSTQEAKELSDDMKRAAAVAVLLAADSGGHVIVHDKGGRCAMAKATPEGIILSECNAVELPVERRPLSCSEPEAQAASTAVPTSLPDSSTLEIEKD